jgi:hypothetical protein
LYFLIVVSLNRAERGPASADYRSSETDAAREANSFGSLDLRFFDVRRRRVQRDGE